MPIRLSSSLAILAPLLLGAAAPAAALEVGTAAAVNSDTFGTPPAADTRLIFLGTDLLFEERLETGATGTTQVLFLDKSTVTIGPDSELLIDRFVYDPQSGTGETVLSFTRGVMRFVGGQISKAEGGVTVRTPTATVGIRGGIGILRQDAEGTRVIFVAGDEMSISSGLDPGIKITRPGGSATIAPGGGIEDTGVAGSEEIARANGATQGNGGGGLEEGEGPTDSAAGQALGSGLAGDDETLGAPPVSVGSTRRAGPDDLAGASLSLTGEVASATQELATPSPTGEAPGQPPAAMDGGQGGGSSGAGGDGLPVDPGPPGPVDPGPAGPPGPPPTAFGGRLLATPAAGYTDSFGTTFADPVASFLLGGPAPGYDLAVTAHVEDGRWIGSSGSGGLSLPLGDGAFTVGAAETTTPFGPAAGSGFYDAAANFAFYALTTNRPHDAQRLAVWGGTPTPDGGNSSGSGALSYQSYRLEPDPYRGGMIPLVPSDAASLFTAPTVSPVYVLQNRSGKLVRETGFERDGGPHSKVVQASLAIEGQGAAQKSLLFGTVGEPLMTAEGKVLFAQGGRGSLRVRADAPPVRIRSALNSREGASGDHFYGPDRQYFVVRNNSIFGADDDPDLDFDATGYSPLDPLAATPPPEGYLHLARRIDNPAGLGASRDSRQLNGYATGIGESYLPWNGTYEAPYLLSNRHGAPESLQLILVSGSNSAGMAMRLTDRGIAGSDVDSMDLAFGGSNSFRGAFIDDAIFAMRETASTADAAVFGIEPGVNGQTGAGEPDGLGFRSIAVSGQAVPVTGVLPAGVDFCQCRYLEWGWWATQFRWQDTQGPNAGRHEQVHLGSFVAGELPDIGDIPTGGTATFSGHAVGNVFNKGEQYIAVGNFDGSWDFARRKGVIGITDFDGADYSGIRAVSLDGRDFRGFDGSVATPVGAGSIHVDGSLFRAGADPAGAMAGQFKIIDRARFGGAYRAIGTFAGQK